MKKEFESNKPDDIPNCPKCNRPMVRMKSCTGWRCVSAGWFDPTSRKWTGCNGTRWDYDHNAHES